MIDKRKLVKGLLLGALLLIVMGFTRNTFSQQLGAEPPVLKVRQGGSGFSSTSPNALLATGSTASSTFRATSSPTVGFIFATTTTATSTFLGGVTVGQGFSVEDLVSCDTINTNASGVLTCGTDATGAGGGVYPFTPTTLGGTVHQATTSPMLFYQGWTGASSTQGFLNVGFLNATSSTASTFTAAPIFSSLTGVLKGNGSSALTVGVDGTDFTLITALTCSGTDKFSAVTADGTFTCSTDATGGAGGSNPFSSLTVGNTVYQATTSPLYFSGGFLTGSSTIGTLTATSSATFLAGVTITCTGCVTDVNVADIALGGGTSGNYVRTLADSGNSTITVVGSGAEDADVTLNVVDVNCTGCLGTTEIAGLDISADTNLTGGLGLTLTDDDMACDTATGAVFGCLAAADFITFGKKTAFPFATTFSTSSMATTSSLWLQGGVIFASSTNATSTFDGGLSINVLNVSTTTATSTFKGGALFNSISSSNGITVTGGTGVFTNAPVFSSLTGVLKGNGASVLTVAVDGTDFSLITALTCSGTDKFSAVTADGTFTCSADVSGGSSMKDPFIIATNFGSTTVMATSSSLWTGGAFYASSSNATSTFDGGLRVKLLDVSTTTATSTFRGGVSIAGITTSLGLTITGGALNLNSENFTDLTGTGLQNTAGALTLNATGDWTGTIDSNNFAGGAIGAGDLLYGASAGSITELTMAASSTVLTNNGSIPAWTNAPQFSHLRTLTSTSSMVGLTIPSGGLTVSTLTSALVLTGAGGAFAEYAGTSCTNQFVRALSVLGAATCETVDISGDTNLTAGTNITLTGDDLSVDDAFILNTGDIGTGVFDFGGATSFEIPNGGPTIDTTGEIGIDTTSDQLAFYGASAKRILYYRDNLGFAYATSSWNGTTTIRIGPSPAAITVTNAYCETNTGTVGVSLYDGTNRALYMQTASTTINNFTYTASNNSFTAGETIRVDLGTPVSTPTTLSCRFLYTYDAD